jgi:pyruvate formate lyase activating enzyme
MKTFARANYSKSSTVTGCGVSLAGAAARSQKANPGFARFATTAAERCLCPRAKLAASNAARSRKKPFSNAHPGALAYGFGMLGCDLHCGHCQNWVTSQALRDPAAVAGPMRVTPADLVIEAIRPRSRVIVSTYNEPPITSEWAVAVFKEARSAGLMTGFVSNGNGTPKVLEYVRPWVDLCKVDLKSFDDRHYRQLGGRLQPILDTVRRLHEMDFWFEIVTLVIPGFNDSNNELTRLVEFLASVSSDIPWHVTAFHKDYKMTDPENTRPETLMRAAEIGKSAGLRYVYAGNLPGMVGHWENTLARTVGNLSSNATVI